MLTAKDILAEMNAQANAEKARHLSSFFKTGKGEYGEGDRFMGLTVPQQRKIAKKYTTVSLDVLNELIRSEFHEQRLTALLILIRKYQKTSVREEQETYIRFYLEHTSFINNWDLVDLSCYFLLGHWLSDKDRSLLYRLAHSSNFWEQRIAIVSCMYFVRQKDFKDCLAIADLLLEHPHDLIQKAVGWLLREVGKKDENLLTKFLDDRHTRMPRTMLRYAIERFPEEKRQQYLQSGKHRKKSIPALKTEEKF